MPAGFAVNDNGATAALAVFTGRAPGQGGILFLIYVAEKIHKSKNAAGFKPVILFPAAFGIRVIPTNFQREIISRGHFDSFR